MVLPGALRLAADQSQLAAVPQHAGHSQLPLDGSGPVPAASLAQGRQRPRQLLLVIPQASVDELGQAVAAPHRVRVPPRVSLRVPAAVPPPVVRSLRVIAVGWPAPFLRQGPLT